MPSSSAEPRVIFCYDIVCPYAYLSHRPLLAIAARHGFSIEWKPVLLGGLYKLDNAKQGPSGSATDTMPSAKRLLVGRDLMRQSARFGVPISFHPRHPVRSLKAMRILASPRLSPSQRKELSQSFFSAYWQENVSIDDPSVLSTICQRFGIDSAIGDEEEAKDSLQKNTKWAFDRGAFGVPSFFIIHHKKAGQDEQAAVDGDNNDLNGRNGIDTNNKNNGKKNRRAKQIVPVEMPSVSEDIVEYELIWGADRLHFVERLIIEGYNHSYHHQPLESLYRAVPMPRPLSELSSSMPPPTVTFIFDFSSPWSFLGYSQLYRLKPYCRIIYQPILLGALFKNIGTPNLPAAAVSESKRRYAMKDLNDWLHWWGEEAFIWPNAFPIRTVIPLRIVLSCIDEEKEAIIDSFYRACWQKDLDIGKEEIIKNVLENTAGRISAVNELLKKASTLEMKEKLKQNNEKAEKLGVIGVPTYLVKKNPSIKDEDAELCWGQDRVGVVCDLLSGWTWSSEQSNTGKKSKL